MNVINTLTPPQPSDIGKVGIDLLHGGTYICYPKFGRPQWNHLGMLSASHWMSLRHTISAAFEEEKKKSMEIEKKHQDNVRQMSQPTGEKTREMLVSLFKKMDPDTKREFLKLHSTSWLATTATCSGCLEICGTKHQCVHLGCSGMCETCHDTFSQLTDNPQCPACGKQQDIVCPVCQDEKEIDQMVLADGGCGHRVCWKCFGSAYKAGHPLVSCPLCRGPFTSGAAQAEAESVLSDSDDDAHEYELTFGGGGGEELPSPIVDLVGANNQPSEQMHDLLEFIHAASAAGLSENIDLWRQAAIADGDLLDGILTE